MKICPRPPLPAKNPMALAHPKPVSSMSFFDRLAERASRFLFEDLPALPEPSPDLWGRTQQTGDFLAWAESLRRQAQAAACALKAASEPPPLRRWPGIAAKSLLCAALSWPAGAAALAFCSLKKDKEEDSAQGQLPPRPEDEAPGPAEWAFLAACALLLPPACAALRFWAPFSEAADRREKAGAIEQAARLLGALAKAHNPEWLSAYLSIQNLLAPEDCASETPAPASCAFQTRALCQGLALWSRTGRSCVLADGSDLLYSGTRKALSQADGFRALANPASPLDPLSAGALLQAAGFLCAVPGASRSPLFNDAALRFFGIDPERPENACPKLASERLLAMLSACPEPQYIPEACADALAGLACSLPPKGALACAVAIYEACARHGLAEPLMRRLAQSRGNAPAALACELRRQIAIREAEELLAASSAPLDRSRQSAL